MPFFARKISCNFFFKKNLVSTEAVYVQLTKFPLSVDCQAAATHEGIISVCSKLIK
jgi:hypothetical protein